VGVYSGFPENQIQKHFLKQKGKFQQNKKRPIIYEKPEHSPEKSHRSHLPAGNMINFDNLCKQAADRAECFTSRK
jgi:hypothetical protein